MLLKMWKNFRQETERKYKEGLDRNMEAWKKKVMKLHEISDFLFYFDQFIEWDPEDGSCTLMGNYIKGFPEKGEILYLYSGQAEQLGTGVLLSPPEENAEKMRGFTKEKKYLLRMQIKIEETEEEDKQFFFSQMELALSLLTEIPPEKLQ